MRVILNTHDRLVLSDLNLGIGALLAAVAALPALMAWGYFRAGILTGGIALAAISMLLIVGCAGAFVRPVIITLNRPGDRIEIVERGLFGTRRETHVLHRIKGATTQIKIIRNKPGDHIGEHRRRPRPEPRTWREALVDQNANQIALTSAYGSQAAAETAAATINGWIGADLVAAKSRKA